MGQRFRTQGLVVALALALFAVWPQPSTWALLAFYGAALVLASLLDLRRRLADADPWLLVLLLAGLALPGLVSLVRLYPTWIEEEGLSGFPGLLGERMQVEE